MRALVGALCLAACASMGPPDEGLEGCWVARGPAQTAATMRWFPDPERAGVINGGLVRQIEPGPPEFTPFTLEPNGEEREFCRIGDPKVCWVIARGDSGLVGTGLAFIDRHGSRLRISVLDARGETEIFQGRASACE